MTIAHPSVSCVCLTYGRPDLLEEAICSFLMQDYGGDKELIVLNDHEQQFLTLDHPDEHREVRIFNFRRRFRTVGEKCNAAVALASHNLLFVWDDDDIYLPHRLSFSVERFDPGKGFFKPAQAWQWNDGVLEGPHSNVFHVGSCWSRELFDSVRGYAAMGNGYDQEIEARFEEIRPGSTEPYDIGADEIYYIYRWVGTGSYHMSEFGRDAPGQNVEQQSVSVFVESQMRTGRLRTGEIVLKPRWIANYAALTRGHLAARPPE